MSYRTLANRILEWKHDPSTKDNEEYLDELEALIEAWVAEETNALRDPKSKAVYANEALKSLNAGSYGPPSWRHKHAWHEFVYDVRADIIGGPQTYHDIGWVCACGKVDWGDNK